MLALRLANPNFYLLDEPTNHLDIEGQEALEAELLEHQASCLLASHDRCFIRAIGNRFWLIEKRRLTEVEDPEEFFRSVAETTVEENGCGYPTRRCPHRSFELNLSTRAGGFAAELPLGYAACSTDRLAARFQAGEGHLLRLNSVWRQKFSVGSWPRATSLGCRHGYAGANRGESIMLILSSIGRIATRYSAARARYRSECALLSLPIELRRTSAGRKSSSTRKTALELAWRLDRAR